MNALVIDPLKQLELFCLRYSAFYSTFYHFSKTRGIDFNFPPKQGRGIEKMLPHCGKQPVELIYKMCEYDPDERITAKQALRHPYFKELRYC